MLLCFFYHLVLYLILKNLHKKSYVSLCFRSSSIFAAKLFNFSVRNGKRWARFVLNTRKFFLLEIERFDRSNLDSRSPQAKKSVWQLVPVGWTYCYAYTSGLSNWWSVSCRYGNLILRSASYLDAFSTYPFNT